MDIISTYGPILLVLAIIFGVFMTWGIGANDVANAVGPLAAIASAITEGTVAAKVTLPIWILIVGAIGISIGLMLYGPKVIEIVGEKITKLNRVRAFCIALSAAITVIIASTLGLPVSSTHIAVGAVFGVGFLREFLVNRKTALAAAITFSEKSGGPVDWQQDNPEEIPLLSARKSQKKAAKAQKRMLVRRSHLMTIIAAWVITVPAAALLSGLIFLALRQLF